MEKYDYRVSLSIAIKQYIKDNDIDIATVEWNDLYDALWVADEVTGNGSGSYTFSAWQAEENLCHNWYLMQEMCDEYGVNPRTSNPEALDVGIRCYLLGAVLAEVLNGCEEPHE